jgi:twinkle protein
MTSLSEYGIKTRSQSPGQYKTKCPQCENTRKSKNKHDQPLSVTIESGGGAVWKCHNCEWEGGFGGGDKHQRDHRPVYRKPKPFEPDQTPEKVDPMIKWFRARGISLGTMQHFNIRKLNHFVAGEDQPCIAFPYYEAGELVNIKYRTKDKQFGQEAGAKRTLYNIDAVKARFDKGKLTIHADETISGDVSMPEDSNPFKTVIFVEGENDVLAMHEAGITHVISLPDGAPKEAKFDADDKRFAALANAEWLAEAEKVIIAVDMDGPGEALALELLHRFGSDTCWRVKWPLMNDAQTKDANECLVDHGADVVRECVAAAIPYPVDGLYPAMDYKTELLDIYHGRTSQPLSTGFPSLDEIYRIMPGTFHVVTGIPNHGKSTFVDQLTVNLARNEKWKFAVFSPEHSVAQHIRRISENVNKKPFDVGINERMTEAELLRGLEFIDKHYTFIESKEAAPTIDWLLEKAKVACLRYGVRGIVVDPYNEINATRASGKREDEHIRDLIARCKRFCQRHGVVMWMVAHPSKMPRTDDGKIHAPTMYDISGAAHWHNMADVGLVVHRDFDENETAVITRKIREQRLYGEIGEQKFRYNTAKRIYEEIRETPRQLLYQD